MNGKTIDVPKYVKDAFDEIGQDYFEAKSDPEWCRSELFEDGYSVTAGFSRNKMDEERARRLFGSDVEVGEMTEDAEGPYFGTEYLTVRKFFADGGISESDWSKDLKKRKKNKIRRGGVVDVLRRPGDWDDDDEGGFDPGEGGGDLGGGGDAGGMMESKKEEEEEKEEKREEDVENARADAEIAIANLDKAKAEKELEELGEADGGGEIKEVWYIADDEGDPMDYMEGLQAGFYLSEEDAEKAVQKWLSEQLAEGKDPTDFLYQLKKLEDGQFDSDIDIVKV